MKTIKEIADICSMSKTSVNRAIAELQIEKTMSGNKNFVSDEDADRIVSLLCGFGKTCSNLNETSETNQSKTKTETEQINPNSSDSSNSVNSVSEKNNSDLVNFLMEQIKVKDKQISELQEENKMLIHSQAYTLKQIESLQKAEIIEVEEETRPIKNSTSQEQGKKWFQFWK